MIELFAARFRYFRREERIQFDREEVAVNDETVERLPRRATHGADVSA